MNFEEASIEADFASALHDDELFGALEPPPNNSWCGINLICLIVCLELF